MSNTAGQSPNGLHFLGLAEGLFGLVVLDTSAQDDEAKREIISQFLQQPNLFRRERAGLG